jgi:internalin A
MPGEDMKSAPYVGTPRAFISYSKVDKTLLAAFKKRLSPLIGAKMLTLWDDSDIRPGEEWHPAIQHALGQAEVIFLLLSPDFLDTRYVLENELNIAMRRHESKEAVVIPIKLRKCHWDLFPFGALQGLPRKDGWIDSDAKPDEVWYEVVDEIKDLVKKTFSPR